MVDWNSYRVRLNLVGRSRWPRGQRCEPQWRVNCTNNDYDLWFVWNGRGSMRLHDGWKDLRPGMCIWMRPGWRYEATQNPQDPLCLNFIHFSLLDERGKPLPPNAPLPPEYLEPPDPQLAEAITRRIVEVSWGFAPHGYALVPANDPATILGQQMLTALLMELDHASDPTRRGGQFSQRQRRTVEQAACRIMESPREVPSVPELARQAGYSSDHFIRIFRDATGLTPQKFVVQARTRLAQRLLRETDMTVGEIAEAAGYRDIYFFSRQFKHLIGTSPSGYRNRSAAGTEKTS